MTLSAGTRLGPYEIVAAIGAGGMGEVFRARDTKLNRDVAIKVLPAAFADDPERLARFTREAQTLASLNHPNVAAIYGIEEIASSASSDGLVAMTKGVAVGASLALVMELVEGEDLTAHIARGPIPITEALPIARQIAEALEAAHEQGIVHRDLKPANIKVRTDGTVKVLDFGLAKAMDAGGATNSALSHSPTMSRHMTEAGLIIGTAAYMSPEQAKGKAVDKRADIWAFGVVLYEMLTGKRLFRGEDVSDILAAVLRQDVDFKALPADTPPSVCRLVARCLDRDLKHRLRDIGEARIALAESSVAADALANPPAASRSGARWPMVAALSLLTLGLGVAIGAILLGRAPGAVQAGVMRFGIDVEPGLHLGSAPLASQFEGRPAFSSLALSPDGRHLVYVGHDGTVSRLYHRPIDQDRAEALPGTEGAVTPVFSPDSREVLFFSRQGIRRAALAGGPPRTIVVGEAPWPAGEAADYNVLVGASWTDDDWIAAGGRGGIIRFPANGGAVETLISAAPDERLRCPDELPGGSAILFNVGDSDIPSRWDIAVQRVGSKNRHIVVRGGSCPRYVDSGHILFMRRGAVLAAPFDLATLRTTGDPVPVVENVMHAELGGYAAYRTGLGHFSVSRTGGLAYLPGGVMRVNPNSLVWVDRRGVEQPLPVDQARSLEPALSPDSSRMVWRRGPTGDRQIWIFDFGPGVSRPLTTQGDFANPVWSPDGKRLAVQAAPKSGPRGLALIDVDGSAPPRLLAAAGAGFLAPTDWSVNNVLVFLKPDIWTMPMDGSSQPTRFFESSAAVRDPRFSPDGRFISYGSDETGSSEIYVRPFPAGTPVTRVSVNGGTSSVWSRDGRELFYRQGTRMMAVRISIEDGFRQLGPPRELFSGDYETSNPTDSWDLAQDGRFIMAKPIAGPDPQPVIRINVVLNWFAELNRLAPVKK